MISSLKELFGRSESKEESSPYKIADGGNVDSENYNEGSEWRTKTPDGYTKEPFRTPGEEEEQYRDSLEGVSEAAAERLTLLVENHDFQGMPTSKVRTNWGIEWLDNGSFRNVYGFLTDSDIPMGNPEDYVMKVPGKHEEWTNEEEVKAYSRLQDTPVEDYLVPIVDFGEDYKWLLMERVDNTEPTREKVREMKLNCDALGWEYSDWKPDNCGFVDGEPVLIDYGYHNKVSEKLK